MSCRVTQIALTYKNRMEYNWSLGVLCISQD